jgi:hypothetical protein
MKAFVKRRAVLLRLEELLPRSWQLSVPPLKEAKETPDLAAGLLLHRR